MNHILPQNKHQACQRIITHSLTTTKGISWSKEIKMAQKILDDFPYLWTCSPSLFKVGLFSLAWYLTKEGLKFLEQNRPIEFKTEKFDLAPNPIGENVIFEKKSAGNLLEFVRK